jgi:hypothetical protein
MAAREGTETMLTDPAAIGGHETLLPVIRRHAEANIGYFRRNRRFLRFVDTRQKWLLLHLVAVTCHGDDHALFPGAAANWICERATARGISSRNTALAFLNQLAAYGYLHKNDYRGDRRFKLISLSEGAQAALVDWTCMLIEIATGNDAWTLDRKTVMGIHLEMMAGLLENPRWVEAPVDICLTQDMRGGWLVVSEIMRHLARTTTGEPWIPAPGLSVPAMAESFGLSRSTLYRLVRVSAEAGIMAWQERQAVSTLVVNLYHVRQYSRWIHRLLAATAASYFKAVGRGPADGTDDLDGPLVSDPALVEHRLEILQETSPALTTSGPESRRHP